MQGSEPTLATDRTAAPEGRDRRNRLLVSVVRVSESVRLVNHNERGQMSHDGAHAPYLQQGPPQAYGQPHVGHPGGFPTDRRRSSIETKPFFLTSEFIVSLLTSIAIGISAATMDAFGGWRGWFRV